MKKVTTDKRILITGGTGTWGQEFAKQLLKTEPKEIVIFSRNEAAQVAMKHRFGDNRLKFVIGDIRDSQAIMDAMENIDIVFHTAALKHVTKAEQQPREAVKSNIDGAINVIEACLQNMVDICVNISTDKVCDANCFYGKTKAVAEGLFTEANNRTEHTDFFSVRSGNILGSAGSVIPIWIQQIQTVNTIKLTDPGMKRFFITVHDAVRLTLKAIDISDRGEVFVFKMPAFFVSDLAKIVIQYYGNEQTVIDNIGLMPGERLIEWLITNEEAIRSVSVPDYYIIYPLIHIRATKPKADLGRIDKGYCMNDYDNSDIELLRKMFKQTGY